MNIETIFWDFDGVILDSNAVRDKGFELTLSNYPDKQVEELLHYHRKNGGLSRYLKFRYFFEKIRGEEVTEEQIMKLAKQFSKIMLQELAKPQLLIEETLAFIKANHCQYKMHIVSGSDQEELRALCASLQIVQFFTSIHGSPMPKVKWVANLLDKHEYDRSKTILIGDSINDYEAAVENEIGFMGYGNEKVAKLTSATLQIR